jgi:N-acetylmuramoyl-L-alanine amidase CwlA
VGTGKRGSYNYTPTAHIQIEVCEDDLKDKEYFYACFRRASILCADLCARYGWEPDVIVSHKEAYKLGYASNHADIDHWMKKHGFTMKDFRQRVDLLLHPEKLIDAGDTVQFVGTKQYTNASKLLGKKAKPCEATVLQIYRLGSSRHPYLVKGSGVYGWVDEADVVK